MRKLKILILYILMTLTLLAQEGYIASFNTLRIGKAQKDFKLMSKVLEGFDVVGLIEVMNPIGVERLIKELEKESGVR
ncbi:MAG: LuxR family transcriptional regulator, partial [Fusobacterium mortiferum]|nr:LuxR family transcriptional regulator [Fusobacterium mortiferum]